MDICRQINSKEQTTQALGEQSSVKEILVNKKCPLHVNQRCDLIHLNSTTTTHQICMKCAQKEKIPLSEVIFIDDLMKADSDSFFSGFPVLTDPDLISQVETAHQQIDEILKQTEEYFSELKQQLDSALEIAKSRVKTSLAKLSDLHFDMIGQYKDVSKIDEFKKIVINNNKSNGDQILHEYIFNLNQKSSTNTQRISKALKPFQNLIVSYKKNDLENSQKLLLTIISKIRIFEEIKEDESMILINSLPSVNINDSSSEKLQRAQESLRNNHNQVDTHAKENQVGDQIFENENQDESPYVKKARQIASKIKVQALGDNKNYSMNTISEILEQSIELAEEEYVEVTLQNRAERRGFMYFDAAETYQYLAFEYNDEVENILQKAQKTLLEILNIRFEDYEESVNLLIEKGHEQQIEMLIASMKQKIKEKIDATKDLTIDEAKKIIKFQIKILKQPPELLKQTINKLGTSLDSIQLIPIFIDIFLKDQIFEEFQVEEEDQIKLLNNPDITSDHEIIQFLQEIEEETFALMNLASYFGEDGQ